MPLALMVQPLALDPAEELIQVKVFLHFSTTLYYYFLHISIIPCGSCTGMDIQTTSKE
jgi:hypothetical protein